MTFFDYAAIVVVAVLTYFTFHKLRDRRHVARRAAFLRKWGRHDSDEGAGNGRG
jgi:hypothetical protein